jgi:3-isopropylmalate/(R)-2-methylmalate dehydratase small subunit
MSNSQGSSLNSQGSSLHSQAIVQLEGRGLSLRGHDIDTDRIMPARFHLAVSFEGLEQHLFEDDRKADAAHAFNDPRYAGASMLVVNTNFGCGSSREHAPQGLVRAGYKAVVGESFSEIFQGNSAMLGMPCFVASHDDIERLQALIEVAPDTTITADVAEETVTAGALRITAALPAALRDGFLSGQWNPTAMLLERFDEVRAVSGRLPYINGF